MFLQKLLCFIFGHKFDPDGVLHRGFDARCIHCGKKSRCARMKDYL